MAKTNAFAESRNGVLCGSHLAEGENLFQQKQYGAASIALSKARVYSENPASIDENLEAWNGLLVRQADQLEEETQYEEAALALEQAGRFTQGADLHRPRIKRLRELAGQKGDALSAKAKAQESADAAKRANAQVDARALFSGAQQLERAAEQAFAFGAFEKAAGLWDRTAQEYRRAVSHANAVAALRKATAEYERELAKYDRDRLLRHGGWAWEKVQAAVSQGETASDPLKAVSSYSDATRLLPEAAQAADREYAAGQQRREQARFDTHVAAARKLYGQGKYKQALAKVDLALVIKAGDAAGLAVKKAIKAKMGPPKQLTLDLGSGVTLKLALIPAGRFLMGSPSGEKNRRDDEGPQHRVTISKPFYMGIHEVTQEQYQAVMGTNPSKFKGASNPVEQVSWNECVAFCRKLSSRTGREVRLPTEGEWEYACRAGSSTRFSCGDRDEDLHRYGNYCDRSNTNGFDWQDKNHDDGHDKTASVGSYPPNAFGLHDMHGNVWESCQDRYGKYANADIRDPKGPSSGSYRVLRGGSWYYTPWFCRSAYRNWSLPGLRYNGLGFRVVVSLVRVD